MSTPPRTVRATLSCRFGRLLKAIGCARLSASAFGDAIASCPLWPEPHLELGESLIALSDWEAAERALAQAIRLRPEHAGARGNRALALSKTGRLREAIAELESMARLLPHDVHLHLLLGAVYRRAQRQQDAVRAFRWAVRLPPAPVTVRWHLGEALLGAEAWATVRHSYRGAVAVEPTSVAAIPAWGSCLNQHPEQVPREFRRIAPRPPRPGTPFLRREVRLPRLGGAVAAVRSAWRGPAFLLNLALAFPRALVRRPRAAVRAFPARPVPRTTPRTQWRRSAS
jgi:tetratricopeptide (TPR) repeat protein